SMSFPQWMLAIAAIVLVSLAITGLGFVFAWYLDSVQGFHSIMNLVIFPMWLLSGAFFPLTSVPGYLQFLMKLNPVTYGVLLLQNAFGMSHELNPTVGFCMLSLMLFSFAFLFLSVRIMHIPR